MTEDPNRGDPALRSLADRHGFGYDAARHMLQALQAGNGTMAQFDHPDLGGFGQWSAGGMVMVGRMNDHALKARVAALCTDLVAALPSFAAGASAAGRSQPWWPDGLGRPASVGAQDGMRYATFPESRRLAVETGGRLRLYDTGTHVITGAAQAQGAGHALRFSGPHGPISLDDLGPVETGPEPSSEPARAVPRLATADAPAPQRPAAPTGQADVLSILERLADFRARGILTDEEFSAKKADLLARL